MGRSTKGRPPIPFEVPVISARAIGTARYPQSVLQGYRKWTRGLTAARLKAMPSGKDGLGALETVIIEAFQLLTEQVPLSTTEPTKLRRDLTGRGVIDAIQKLNVLWRKVKAETHRRDHHLPISGRESRSGRLIGRFSWESSAKIGRKIKKKRFGDSKGSGDIASAIKALGKSARPARLVEWLMNNRPLDESYSEAESTWHKRVRREGERKKHATRAADDHLAELRRQDSRALDLAQQAQRAKRLQRKYSGMSISEALRAASK